MSEQQPPAERDTAAVAGPTEAPGTQDQPQEPDYRQRYENLQPEYTRTTQELADIKRQNEWYQLLVTSTDPDTQRQAAEALGFDLPDEEPEEVESAEYEDPYADLRQELDELKAWKEQNTTQEREAAAFEYLNGHIAQEVSRVGLDQLNDKARDWVVSRALALPGIPAPPGAPHDELPNIEAAYQEWQDLVTEEQRNWAKVKRGAPYVPPGGQPANEVPDTGTGHDARMNRALRFLQESEMQD
jgi:hypothetical protein